MPYRAAFNDDNLDREGLRREEKALLPEMQLFVNTLKIPHRDYCNYPCNAVPFNQCKGVFSPRRFSGPTVPGPDH
jgi:hypothetical protein